MERISRGRGVRTRGGARTRGGGRTRASAPLRGGVRVRGGGSFRGERGASAVGRGTARPSLSALLYNMMLEDVPQGSGLERPLHPKRKRFLPSAMTKVESVGSVVEEVLAVASPTPSGLVVPKSESSPSTSLNFEAPSPALYVECGGSGTSTPRTARGGPSTPKTRPTHTATKRRLRHLQNEEIIEHLFSYGSDGDDEDEDDDDSFPIPIPRTARVFLEDEDEEEGTAPAGPNYAWPPPLPTSGSVEPVDRMVSSPDPVEQPAVALSDPVGQSTDLHKFDFKWRAFSQPQVEPELRRESFSDINCGATFPYATPYDAFVAIWDRHIMEHIVAETNRYAQQLAAIMLQSNTLCPTSRITKWVDTTVDELYVFFAITLAMGVVVKTRLEEYWTCSQDIFVTPEFTTAMRYDRFLLLSRCIHFRNNETCDPSTLSRAEAKLFKVQPLIDHLNFKFSTLYNMEQNVALDESLTMWKGWLDINQFIKNKAAAVGIKTYEVCESRTGYLWRFEVHAGHEERSDAEASPVSGVIPSIVLRLLNGLEHRGHTIWMDNFYNSPALARELKCLGFDCVGTLRTNRQFVPTELKQLSKGNMVVGQVCGCTSGDVDLVVWRDKNRVALISTYHGLATVTCGDTLKPTAIHDYNICMGGVDRKDQMLAMFPLERKRMAIWYKKLFRRLLNVSTLNAYILFKGEHTTNHRSFRKTLVTELLSRHSPQNRPLPITHIKSDSNTRGFEHYPLQYDTTQHTNKGQRHRRNCAECGKRVSTYCNGCNKALCAFTCFGPYHSKLYRKKSQ